MRINLLLVMLLPLQAILAARPALRFPLNEGAGDVVVDRDGKREARVTQPRWLRSSFRAALGFDGEHTVLVLGDLADVDTANGFSVSLWFRSDGLTRHEPQALIAWSPTLRLLVYPGSRKFLVDVYGPGGARVYETPSAPIELERWHHAVVSYAPGRPGVHLFLDGAPIFSQPEGVGVPARSSESARVGLGVSDEQKRYFGGMIANLTFWSHALSVEEARQTMNAGKNELAQTFRGDGDLIPNADAPVLTVDDRKQLFIDDRFIESLRDIALTMNEPAKIGPVVLPDRPWEDRRVGFCDSVVEHEGRFMLFYSCMAQDRGIFVCLATSQDGVHWDKPSLGVIDFDGSKDNNIVLPDQGETVVFLDPHGVPEERFKCVSVRYWPDPEKAGLYVHTSPDGVRWRICEERVFPLSPDTANMAMWDRQRGKYVAHIRVWDSMRKVGRVEMDDIRKPWPFDPLEAPYYIWGKDKIPVPSREVPLAFGYDESDPIPSDHYNSGAVEYPWADSAYLMFPAAYLHFPDPPAGKYGNDGLLDIQLATSRDGVSYTRLSRAPYIPLSPEGDKDSKCLYMATGMLRHEDDILQYYAGYEITHGAPQDHPPEPLGSICAVRQRLDGFISVDAAYGGGQVLTPPLTFAGTRLELNLDCSAMGSCRVALLDRSGELISGFSAGACDPISGNKVRQTVTWQGNADVSTLAGTPVRLHFLLRACKLYAFQFRGDLAP